MIELFIQINKNKQTNLIIVEGIPGSGKSTTAAMIAEALQKTGKNVVCVDEGAPEHPATMISPISRQSDRRSSPNGALL